MKFLVRTNLTKSLGLKEVWPKSTASDFLNRPGNVYKIINDGCVEFERFLSVEFDSWNWVCFLSLLCKQNLLCCDSWFTMNNCVLSHFSCVWLSVALWIVACQDPLPMGFFRQEYWSGLPCPSSRGSAWPRNWTDISYDSCMAGMFFTTSSTWEVHE